MPVSDPSLKDEALKEKWERILALKQEVSKVLEGARRDRVIGHPLDADVRLMADGETLEFLTSVEPLLEDVFICSKVEVSKGDGPFIESENFTRLGVEAAKAPGSKCPRCWHYREDIGTNKAHPEICVRCAEQLA
ncbi:MAG TPA: zinc finger domain-containing protein [Desulfomonilia bacterium]|nr:zinc finger domain-containing protein [Desulfomonilia bacterium]